MTLSLVPLPCRPIFFSFICFLYNVFRGYHLVSFHFANLLTDGTAFAGTDELGVRPSLANRQLHQLVNPFTALHPQASYVCVDFYCDMLTHI